jgi:hypothetical protein
MTATLWISILPRGRVRSRYQRTLSPSAHRVRRETLYLNPGSAGPRRFSLTISLGLVTIRADELQPRLVTLMENLR